MDRNACSRRWRDLSQRQRAAIVTASVAESLVTAVAAVDLSRRPRSQVRGPKALWWLALLVQPIGPPAYLLFGRRAPSDTPRESRDATHVAATDVTAADVVGVATG